MKRTLALTTAGLILAGCGGSVGEKNASSPAPSPTTSSATSDPGYTPPVEEDKGPAKLLLGEPATIQSDDIDTGTITVSKLRITTTPSDPYGEGPSEKYFLIFTVKMKASAPAFSADSTEFYVRAKDGEHIDSGEGNSYDAVDYNKVLDFVELNTGEHTTLFLVFDSPVKHGTLAYSPNYDGGPIASWEF